MTEGGDSDRGRESEEARERQSEKDILVGRETATEEERERGGERGTG